MDTTELAWFKSTYSGSSGDSCVEVATAPGTVRVRDSKNEQSPELTLSPASWAHFVSYAALG
ncbi:MULTISPECIES: DUF397 domain-containing protein [Streptomyces]|uniref:DUF397 domain-containing protein n=1 Tax=Streptomyces TaxID=1883 RepID=UPI00081B77E2|nr:MULTISPECIES: DUF397 domain-containing protein [unclassified Streptomyces]MYQ55597.1 DUF397 domain-containing protein [Streptomyces sp. SID4941]SCE39945.1 protein of unknown function [Streptomyces sp. PalvLS-984]SDB87324.1 protein of unknown function [Streptomyces sp. AmelKG-A3]